MPCFTGIDNYRAEGELDNSRTSMPVHVRQCTSGAETSKHAGHMFALWMHHTKEKPVAAMFA